MKHNYKNEVIEQRIRKIWHKALQAKDVNRALKRYRQALNIYREMRVTLNDTYAQIQK